MLLQAKFNYELSVGVGEECLLHSNGALSISFPCNICRILNPETHTWSHSVSFSCTVKLSNKNFGSPKTKVYIIVSPVVINHIVSLFFFSITESRNRLGNLCLMTPMKNACAFLLKVESEPFGVNN